MYMVFDQPCQAAATPVLVTGPDPGSSLYSSSAAFVCMTVSVSEVGLTMQVGLQGVDNGAMRFTNVRIPRDNLLDRFATVDRGGKYSSPYSPGRRFAATLGELTGGRVGLTCGSLGVLKPSSPSAPAFASKTLETSVLSQWCKSASALVSVKVLLVVSDDRWMRHCCCSGRAYKLSVSPVVHSATSCQVCQASTSNPMAVGG